MHIQKIVLSLLGLVVAGSLTAQSLPTTNQSRPGHPPRSGPVRTPRTPTSFGDPLPGLSFTEAQNFTFGLEQFKKSESPEEGLGPIFNAQNCAVCHTQPLKLTGDPAVGGAGAITETRFGASLANGGFNPIPNEGNTLLHQMAINIETQETIPKDATIVAHRKTTPLFGLGLIEAIPDWTILANVHRPAVDGVTGKGAILNDSVTQGIGINKVGRFGWKAQQSTVLAFSGDAYLNEMGISNRLFPLDLPPAGDIARLDAAEATVGLSRLVAQDKPKDVTKPHDVDTNKDDTDRFTDFMRFLAPPPVKALTPQALAGQNAFRAINCVACHKPSMQTGRSQFSQQLSFKNVALYSDLLLHDMGLLGDGIAQAAAGPNDMRTAPLWGLRARAPYLHDGRAQTVVEAILLHDGEAKIIRDRFAALPEDVQDAIVAFLNSI
jgi:CxxC motif-containing protein (DUF1111 family)